MEVELLNEDIEKLKRAEVNFNNSYSNLKLLSLSNEPLSPLSELDGKCQGDQVPEREAQDVENERNSLELCLALNRKFQLYINQTLAKISTILEHNKKHQETVQNEFSEMLQDNHGCLKRRTFSLYSTPYFKDFEGSFPKTNELTAKKSEAGLINPYFKPLKPWDQKEQEMLVKSVKAERLQKLLRPYMNRKQIEYDKCENAIEGSKEHLESSRNLQEIEMAIKNIQEWTDPKLIYGNPEDVHDIDWMKIANVDLKGEKSADYCQQFWQIEGHPLINKSDWTSDEDARLVELADEFKKRRWKDIAEQLGTKRSAFQCFVRYQMNFNSLLHSKWTSADDRLLEKSVNKCMKKNDEIIWKLVSKGVKTRTPEECIYRWEQLAPRIKARSKWTRDLDKKLDDAVKVFGPNWARVATFIPGKAGSQCRDRWANTLNKALRSGSWSKNEDELLWKAVREHGLFGQWARIAREHLVGRSDNQILLRYKRLVRWEKESSKNSQSSTTQRLTVPQRPVSFTATKAGKANNKESDDDVIFCRTEQKARKEEYSFRKRKRGTVALKVDLDDTDVSDDDAKLLSDNEKLSDEEEVNKKPRLDFECDDIDVRNVIHSAPSASDDMRNVVICSAPSASDDIQQTSRAASTSSSSFVDQVSLLIPCSVRLDSSFRRFGTSIQEMENNIESSQNCTDEDASDYGDDDYDDDDDDDSKITFSLPRRMSTLSQKESSRLDKEIAKMLVPSAHRGFTEVNSNNIRSHQLTKPDFKPDREQRVTNLFETALKLSTQHMAESAVGANPSIMMPLLPPNSSSMNGFLKLLNERNQLVRTAQLFQFPKNHKFPLPWKRTKLENLVDSSRACDFFNLDDVCGEDDSESEALVHLRETLYSNDDKSKTEVVGSNRQASRFYRKMKSSPEFSFFESRFGSCFFWPLLLSYHSSSTPVNAN